MQLWQKLSSLNFCLHHAPFSTHVDEGSSNEDAEALIDSRGFLVWGHCRMYCSRFFFHLKKHWVWQTCTRSPLRTQPRLLRRVCNFKENWQKMAWKKFTVAPLMFYQRLGRTRVFAVCNEVFQQQCAFYRFNSRRWMTIFIAVLVSSKLENARHLVVLNIPTSFCSMDQG